MCWFRSPLCFTILSLIAHGPVQAVLTFRQVLVHTDVNLLQVCDARTLEPKRILTYAQIDSKLSGYGICSHPPKDRKRGMTFNYLIDPQTGVLSIFALSIAAKPTSLRWKTPIPCKPCYTHSLAMTDKYVVFIRNVSGLAPDRVRPSRRALLTRPHSP